jgi:hypothetical protein
MVSGDLTARLSISTPPPEISDAARYLDDAVTAHLEGKAALADELLRAADISAIYGWLKSIWARSEVHLVPGNKPSPVRAKELREPVRMPSKAERQQIHRRDGYNCRFCTMPVIRPEIRDKIRAKYPKAVRWGRKESEQHAAFQAMWAQYDHLLPHALGGTNELSNIVLACAACNFGRGGYSLNDVGVQDPRDRPVVASSWDGLERFR